MEQSIYLILENGTVFIGKAFGATGEVTGEVVFTTSMTGYLETLTDPSYYGQIVLQTFPLIGNYGVIPSDFESAEPKLSAYIVREWCHDPSNFRCEGDLDAFLKASNIVGMYGIDTRRLTKIIRESGVMNARITSRLPEDLSSVLKELAAYRITDAVGHVSCKETKEYPAEKLHAVCFMGFRRKGEHRARAAKAWMSCCPYAGRGDCGGDSRTEAGRRYAFERAGRSR